MLKEGGWLYLDTGVLQFGKKITAINGNQKKEVAGTSMEEILLRFDSKIKDPRRSKKGSNVVKILKE